MDFHKFKVAVVAQFNKMKAHPLFRTSVAKDVMWDTYLKSFPVGTDPIYKNRTEHDCNACKGFIRAVGNVVAVIDGKKVSIWDVDAGHYAYQAVTDALSEAVKNAEIEDIFLHHERVAGVNENFADTDEGVKSWEHFFINVPAEYVVDNTESGKRRSDARGVRDSLYRALTDISLDAIDTVIELIDQNAIYRGNEFRFVVGEFRKLKLKASTLSENQLKLMSWPMSLNAPVTASKIRNSAIGTLLTDLSGDIDLDKAVRAYEKIMAPENYQRPTVLQSKRAIAEAGKKIEERGLTSALNRRFATINDITINNLIFANREARKLMNVSVFDELAASAPSNKTLNSDKLEQVSIEKFLSDFVPNATSIEALFEQKHVNNLVSLIAPEDPTAGNLFKWSNNFSWSYKGDMADSIKERVKQAGGSIEGVLCCRLAWDYDDDLDFYMVEPSGNEIYFGNRKTVSRCGGMLDVDANGGDGIRKNPVENIFYKSKSKLQSGRYTLKVKNYMRRSDGRDFTVEVEFDGTVHTMHYNGILKSKEEIFVMTLVYDKKTEKFTIESSIPASNGTVTEWNLTTQDFHKVNVLMMSPNHWDTNNVGNKHYFFMLDGCLNDGKARGFFNEFLRSDLNDLRKVLEMVGAKMKTVNSDQQLSGLGFSSTNKNSIVCRVKGKVSRVVNVVF